MPTRDAATAIHGFKMPNRGVNLYKNMLDIHPEECFSTKNLFWRHGLVKRGGGVKWDTTAVVASKQVLGLHRYYKSDGTRQTLAASDTVVKYGTGSGWTNAKTGLTAEKQTHMVNWLDKVFVCNGTDTPWTWDGSSATDITGTATPTAKQFLPYQDRLLAISGGDLVWSASFPATPETATWFTIAETNVRPDNILYGMVGHSQNNTDSGVETAVLLAGASGMYLFYGTALDATGTNDYVIQQLAIPVGM